jgi:hypothetical protein
VKATPLKLQNYFKELYIYNSDNDTSCILPPYGASSAKKRGACSKKACLIPRSNHYLVIATIAYRFIRKLRSHIITKHYFLRTLKPKSEIMVNVGLRTLDMHRMIDVKALLDSGATGMFMDRKFAEGNGISLKPLD